MRLPVTWILATALLALTSANPLTKAEDLRIAAEVRLARGTIEDRRMAIEYLDEATRLAPERIDIALLYARALDEAFHLDESRQEYRRAWQLDPRNPEAYAALELSYRNEWIRNFDPAMLDSAIVFAERLVRIRPYSVDAWVRLVPLWTERGNPARAAEAAENAMRYAKRRPEPLLAYGILCWRRGETASADSAFRASLPKLAPELRSWFTDASRVAGESDAVSFANLDTTAQGAWVDSFWTRLDPDPFTPESEARVEYWARVAHVILLFYDPRYGLDARADLYVRYGRPGIVDYNPFGVPLEIKFNRFDGVGKYPNRTQSIATYPVQVQAWYYPDLGMRVYLQDRSLRGVYEPAVAYDFDPATVPNPGMLAKRGDLVQTGNGHALFSTQPPPEIRMNLRGVLARFRSGSTPLLYVELETPADDAETASAQWRLVDAQGRVVREGTVRFGVSACDPGERRTATISESVPPGDYLMMVSARGSNHRRGLMRFPASTEPPAPSLDMSDLVVTCGEPLGGTPVVQFDADFDRAVKGSGPLTAYFEAYGLTPGSDGLSRFEYEVRVATEHEAPSLWSRVMGKPNEVGRIAVRREETQTGPLRRQFLSVPTASLTPGKYRLLVVMRDLVSGAETRRQVEFAKR
jgi:GWxTD domain-containing protein